MAVLIASNLRKELAGSAALRRRLVQGRAPRPAGARRSERRRQDDAAPRARRRGLARRRRARLGEGRPGRAARPATSRRQRQAAPRLRSRRERRTSPPSRRSSARSSAAMAAGAHDEKTLRRYSEAQARLEHAGGYDWRDRAASVVRGLGFTDDDLERPLSSFSGGELTRASLARALAAQPDLLLLDEPTNHLDIESIEWLEEMLRTIDAAVILVAHDRWFLESVTTACSSSRAARSTSFPGKWHVWRLRAGGARSARREDRRAPGGGASRAWSGSSTRFGAKDTKAKQAQSKRKQIERIKATQVESAAAARRTLGFEFLKPKRSGRDRRERRGPGAPCGHEGADRRCELRARTGRARRARSAPNGAGKTTLLETILGRREPNGGRVSIGHGVEIAYFSQHEVELDERGSVLDATVAATGLRRPEAQALLGRFLFSGWEAHEKPVDGALGRRAAAARAGARRRERRELPRARRADQPPRPREPRGAGSCARGVPGDGAARLPRPGAAGRDRGPRCSRSRTAALVSYTGGWAEYRVAGASQSRRPPHRSRNGRSRSASGRSRPDAPRARRTRDRPRRGADRRARATARRPTGQTSTSSQRIAPPAKTSRRCSHAGKSCSKRSNARSVVERPTRV